MNIGAMMERPCVIFIPIKLKNCSYFTSKLTVFTIFFAPSTISTFHFPVETVFVAHRRPVSVIIEYGHSKTTRSSLYHTNFIEIGIREDETFAQQDTFPTSDGNSELIPTGARDSILAAITMLSAEKEGAAAAGAEAEGDAELSCEKEGQ